MTPTHPRPTERVRLNRAFKAIRDAGGMIQTGLCCTSCSWNAVEKRGAIEGDTIAMHHVQGTEVAFPKGRQGRMAERLHIYHNGDTAFICEALRNEGLRVEWNGDQEKAITVWPDYVN